MTLAHYGTWKITALIWTAGVAIVAVEPSVKVAIIVGATALITTVLSRLMDRWFPSPQIKQIQQAQNRMEISVDGNNIARGNHIDYQSEWPNDTRPSGFSVTGSGNMATNGPTSYPN